MGRQKNSEKHMLVGLHIYLKLYNKIPVTLKSTIVFSNLTIQMCYHMLAEKL